jgi:ribonuclease BN (tRNA processing enzyme)
VIDLKVRVLGSRGEIDEKCPGIQKHSGILLDNILFDCGEKEYLELKPKAIFLTHIHPDHWSKDIETDIPVYSIEKPSGAKNWNKLKKLQTISIDNLKITPIPTTHSKKVKSCAFLIENDKRILYTGDLIWINKRYWDRLKNLDLVITEASSLDRDLIRRDKETGEIYGHSSLKRLVQLFKELGAKKIVATHYGAWATDDFKKAKEQIKELGAIPAEDGYSMELELKPEDVEAVSPKVFATPQYGLILVEPHGKWIWEGKKTAILKSRKFEAHIGEPLYLIADKLCYGIITLKEPREINREEFLQLYEKHRVSEEEREKWCRKEPEWCDFPLYYYEFDFDPFDKPKPIRLKVTGPQVFVSSDYIQFLEAKDMDLIELEYFHALAHSNHGDFADPWCELHYEIVSEMMNRGLSHSYVSGPCDRVFDIQELIKEATKDWVNQYIKNLKKYTRAQIGDDFRIVLGWYSSLKRGKKLYKHTKDGDIPITEEDCKKLAVAIVKELIARGATFNRPETYKKYARELFEYVVKEIGEDKIPWKDELTLPKNLEVTDIDVEFVNKLSDKDLEELWKWLHEKWKKEFPDGRTPEDYVNANIFIQIERWKRGLIDYDYVDKDALDKASRYAWQEYGGVTPLEEPEGEEIKLEDVIEAIRETGIIPVKGQPFAAYLIGRIVNEGKIPKDHDIDILFRQNPDPRLVHCLKSSLPEWLSKRIHVVFDYAGPGIGLSIPVYGYALNPLPKELMIKGFGPYRELEGAKLGKYMIGIKPKSGWGKHEFWDVKEAWEKWGSHYIKDGIWVEEKVDGRRHQIHIMEDNSVKMFTEDTHRDRAHVFPEIVKEFQSLHLEKSIIDGEILAFIPTGKAVPKNARAKRELWELMPREDTAAITAAKSLPEDFRKKLVLVIYDIMMYKGKDLTNTPYSERRKIYTSIIPKNLQYIDTVQGELARTMDQFFRLVKKYRSVNGSEGVVCKSAKLLYPVKFSGENRPAEMMKIKNLKEIDVMVIGIKQKKEKATGRPLPTYMYECVIAIPKDKVKEWYPEDIYEKDGKFYAYIGLTYGTKVKCKVGDIITVMPIRIRFYKKDGKTRVTWMFPLFKEKKPEKKEPDPLDVAEKLAKLGTRPAQLEELETIIRVYLKPCPFYSDWDICPLRKRYGIRRAIQNLAIVEEQVLKYPIMCPLARIFKCPYLKDYYYGYIGVKYHPELSEYFEMLDTNALPKWVRVKLQGKYMECPPGEHDFVMESHILTAKFVPKEKKIPETGSQHMDWRMSVNGYLVGWSVVGGSVEKMITPKRLLDNIGKGFRTEEKARQPKVWLFPNKPIAKDPDKLKPGDPEPAIFDVVVGAGEPRGKMFVMTRGKVVFGVQKPYFHEYFLKDGRYFKDWTRIVVRGVRVQKVDPETKQPIKGKYETLWRTMVPKDQMPYALSKRAREKKWKPPKDNKYPFPKDWAAKNFPEEFKAYEEYLKTLKLEVEELTKIRFTLSQHSWKGPEHVRKMPIRQWYLFLDDKGRGSVRTFRLEGVPPFDIQILAWNEGRDDRKYLDWQGKTKPMSRFNPNKEIYGEMIILQKGTVDYSTTTENGREIITLKFGEGQFLSGEWKLEQEEPGSDAYSFYKVTKESLEKEYEFVYHKHCVQRKDNCHFDIRIKMDGYLDEFNLYGDIRELKPGEEVEAFRKTCYQPDRWFLKEGTEVERPLGDVMTWVTVIDYGKVRIIENTPDFVNLVLNSKDFKNVNFIAKRTEHGWIFRREIPVRGLSTGDPLHGKPYSPFIVKKKSTWNYFRVYIYDPKEFTRAEPSEKVKKYLPNLKIPEGVKVYIGLYPVPGKIHHARVFMVEFPDTWKIEDAFEWIKKNKLPEFVSPMIREYRK